MVKWRCGEVLVLLLVTGARAASLPQKKSKFNVDISSLVGRGEGPLPPPNYSKVNI